MPIGGPPSLQTTHITVIYAADVTATYVYRCYVALSIQLRCDDIPQSSPSKTRRHQFWSPVVNRDFPACIRGGLNCRPAPLPGELPSPLRRHVSCPSVGHKFALSADVMLAGPVRFVRANGGSSTQRYVMWRGPCGSQVVPTPMLNV